MRRSLAAAAACLLAAGFAAWGAASSREDWPEPDAMGAANGHCEDVAVVHGEMNHRMIAYTFAVPGHGVIRWDGTTDQPVKPDHSLVVLYDPADPEHRNWAGLGDAREVDAAYGVWRDGRLSQLRAGRIGAGVIGALLLAGSAYFAVSAARARPHGIGLR
jgi:hypothetical protein